MTTSHSRPLPMPLPGGPVDEPGNPHWPVEPDDGQMPPPALPEEEGPGWNRPV